VRRAWPSCTGRGGTMKRLWAYLCVIGVWGGGMAWGQLPQLDNYSGDVWSRPGLTGDWGGLRNTLAAKGVNPDVDLVQSLQGLNSGGLSNDSVLYRYGGHAEYLLNLDTGKLGLWPGGFLRLKGESQFGSYLRGNETGTLLPPDAAALYPLPFDEETTLTSVVFTQFLAKFFGIYLGKIDTFSGDANAFAHEWKTQFMSTGLGPNPVTFTTVPYSTLGAGFLLLPTDSVLFNFSALSPDGTADSAGFDELYEDGVVLAGELRVGIRPFGLPGHQLIGGTWSSKTFNTLEQDPRLLLTVIGLPIGVPIRQQSGSWSAYYNFDQFLYTTSADGSEGFGIFGRVGLADPNTNPLEQFYSVGIGGQGMLPGRSRDRFGIGFYYGRLSSDLRGALLDSSAWGMEIFYNIAATNWLYVTPDIQVIEPAAKQASTAFLTGLRVQMRF
jgi:porin